VLLLSVFGPVKSPWKPTGPARSKWIPGSVRDKAAKGPPRNDGHGDGARTQDDGGDEPEYFTACAPVIGPATCAWSLM
jgi:hypothetical protein